jgi:hypothetical protein
MLRRILGPKREEVARSWRKLPPDINRMAKSMRMIWNGWRM